MLNRIIPLTKPLQTGLRTVTRAAVTTSGLFSKKNNNLSNNTAKNNSNTTQRRQYLADATTVIPDEIEKFGKMAERWWDPTGMLTITYYASIIKLVNILLIQLLSNLLKIFQFPFN